VSLSDTIETDIDKVEAVDKNVVIYLPDPPGDRDNKRKLVSRCQSVWGNFNFYFTIGMLSFFLFWGTLLFHIWPPSLYMNEDMMFWKSFSTPPLQSQQNIPIRVEDLSSHLPAHHHHTAVLEIDLEN